MGGKKEEECVCGGGYGHYYSDELTELLFQNGLILILFERLDFHHTVA